MAIEHVILVMFENRSFDHLLGSRVDWPLGLRNIPAGTAPPSNTWQGTDYPVTFGVGGKDLPVDPGHEPADVAWQLAGSAQNGVPAIVDNSGFVANYAQYCTDHPELIMRSFADGELPAFHSLADKYTLCARWHSSIPSSTWPNRFFVHTGQTPNGMAKDMGGTDKVGGALAGLLGTPTSTFQWIEQNHRKWTIYGMGQSVAISPVHAGLVDDPINRLASLDDFFSEAKSGDLPDYSFIEPPSHETGGAKQADMHPIQGAGDYYLHADNLLAKIYNAMINSPLWDTSLLVVLFDEHGGTYDHVQPGPAIPPTGKASDDPRVDFKRYGVRVPAMLVGPHVPRQIISDTVFDHCSFIRSMGEIFNMPVTGGFGARVPKAASFVPFLTAGVGNTMLSVAEPAVPQLSLSRVRTKYNPKAPISGYQRSLLVAAKARQKMDMEKFHSTVAAKGVDEALKDRGLRRQMKEVLASVDRVATVKGLARAMPKT